jgi:hypothetical protein
MMNDSIHVDQADRDVVEEASWESFAGQKCVEAAWPAKGMIPTLRNVRPDAPPKTLSLVAATPKPRLMRRQCYRSLESVEPPGALLRRPGDRPRSAGGQNPPMRLRANR